MPCSRLTTPVSCLCLLTALPPAAVTVSSVVHCRALSRRTMQPSDVLVWGKKRSTQPSLPRVLKGVPLPGTFSSLAYDTSRRIQDIAPHVVKETMTGARLRRVSPAARRANRASPTPETRQKQGSCCPQRAGSSSNPLTSTRNGRLLWSWCVLFTAPSAGLVGRPLRDDVAAEWPRPSGDFEAFDRPSRASAKPPRIWFECYRLGNLG